MLSMPFADTVAISAWSARPLLLRMPLSLGISMVQGQLAGVDGRQRAGNLQAAAHLGARSIPVMPALMLLMAALINGIGAALHVGQASSSIHAGDTPQPHTGDRGPR